MELEKLLNSLKKNRENISKEELHGRYGTSYNKLLHDIKACAEDHLNKTVLNCKCTNVQAECIKIEFKETNIQKRLSDALFKDVSISEFEAVKSEMEHIIARFTAKRELMQK